MSEQFDPPSDSSRRSVLRATAVGVGGATVASSMGTGVASRGRGPADEVVVENGRSQPTFATSNVIREDVWVETDLDTDGSGSPDRVHVEVARPSSSSEQLPVILEPSPYYGGLNWGTSHPMDEELYVPDEPADRRRGASEPIEITEDDLVEFTGSETSTIGPSAYEEEFLQRGFIFAYAASIGTEYSTGCPTIGGPEEIAGINAVVDWFNGRATAYDSVSGGSPVEATWTNGKTGMIGASYNGTLPNGVAATGVDGLETIVPIVAISSWYDYYRANGAVIATGAGAGGAMDTDSLFDSVLTRSNPSVCNSVRDELVSGQERLTGNRNEFWDERDYVPDAETVDAAVYAVHGLYDTNVKTGNVGQWVDALTGGQTETKHKIWLTQGGHDDPINRHPEPWLDALNVWFTHWLQEPGDEIDDLPTATVERGSGSFDHYDAWPHQDVRSLPVKLQYGGSSPGGLTTYPTIGDQRTESFVDNPNVPTTSLVGSLDSEYSLVYRTEPLSEPLHVSGTIRPNLALSCDEPAALITAILVDYDANGGASIINRGWMNVTNYESLYESYQIGTEPGHYRARFRIHAVDHVFGSNHRLGIVFRSSDYDFTRRPSHNPELTLSPGWSTVELPVVGGFQAFRDAAE
ncbi:CocE/NonD family hydrolase [Halovivax gelatinilyticus]|uniref:CocE/NonD family hydrolase n=1 Tax=Halovivax gelatinilyticus TaxID=2961597 RepID=UPI0020CA6E79|nr:CocE/NonD family hydrolase [Halovivax gelatinilyticus]